MPQIDHTYGRLLGGFPSATEGDLPNVNPIFAGLNVASDVNKVALMAELPIAEIDSIRVAEAQRLLNLANALCRGSNAVEEWLEGMVNTKLRIISLKTFCQFVHPNRILDKSPKHRNRMANFAESEGKLSDAALCYAALDAHRMLEVTRTLSIW